MLHRSIHIFCVARMRIGQVCNGLSFHQPALKVPIPEESNGRIHSKRSNGWDAPEAFDPQNEQKAIQRIHPSKRNTCHDLISRLTPTLLNRITWNRRFCQQTVKGSISLSLSLSLVDFHHLLLSL